MNLKQLTHLLALADQGSFGRAADAVHLSQPALSRSIDSLEELLGARLVDRAYGRVHFTAAGELVLARARELVAGMHQVKHDLALLKGLAIGTLNVGLGPFAAGMLGRPVIAQLLQRQPQLKVRFEVGDANSLCEQLHQRQIELFIADTRELKKQPGLAIKKLPNLAVSLFVVEGHPLLSRGAAMSLDEAMEFPMASPQLPAAVTAMFDALTKRSDREVFNVQCDDLSTLLHFAATAQAVVLAPDLAVEATSAVPLVRLPVKKLSAMHTHYSLVMQANRTLSPAALAFSRLSQQMMGPAAKRSAT
ncbi:MAG: LysR family transcriptional regulator [Proteobacteria bacterium]|nr:LysR family transcriptional regulator [Pseudomonadota bacterium]